MKLLFDENLSFYLVSALADLFPGSKHVKQIGLDSSGDEVIWSYAQSNGFAIVTKDSDFHQRSFLFDPAPKVVWIRRGNCTTNDILEILRSAHETVCAFLISSQETLLVLE